jgi:hypothetical protein
VIRGESTAFMKMLREIKLVKISFKILSLVENISIVIHFVSIVEV